METFYEALQILKWENIEWVKVREYSPLTEFGGWGMKYNLKETVHSVSGNQGIEIKKKDKKRLLMLGTLKAEQAKVCIESYCLN